MHHCTVPCRTLECSSSGATVCLLLFDISIATSSSCFFLNVRRVPFELLWCQTVKQCQSIFVQQICTLGKTLLGEGNFHNSVFKQDLQIILRFVKYFDAACKLKGTLYFSLFLYALFLLWKRAKTRATICLVKTAFWVVFFLSFQFERTKQSNLKHSPSSPEEPTSVLKA